jgi:hypothetical protein
MLVRALPIFLIVAFPGLAQDPSLESQVRELRELVAKLQARVDQLEKKEAAAINPAPAPAAIAVSPVVQAPPPETVAPGSPVAAPAPASVLSNILGGTTLNFAFDGYYDYNFNKPLGRVNLLRAYDVSANSFSLNQADVILENAPDPDHGKRFGARLDFQYGQATQTLQGNPVNEPRPGVYQNIFQAYGTYVFPVAKGLTVDFGKFASSLGFEGNYTKDQVAYSRGYWFDFLPFYHTGFRTALALTNSFTVNYWVVNGTQQTEAFNGFKSQLFGFVDRPNKNLSWTVNYYYGNDHPDVTYYPNGGAPANSLSQQGVPFTPVANPLKGKLHILDTYASWQVNPKLILAGSAEYVIDRAQPASSPEHDAGATAYVRYQLTPKWAVGGRAEYLSDRGGLYSGKTQDLKEFTATLEFKIAEGFIVRNEWRTDLSNQRYFYSDTLGLLKRSQTTATIGLLWWFGPKQGTW